MATPGSLGHIQLKSRTESKAQQCPSIGERASNGPHPSSAPRECVCPVPEDPDTPPPTTTIHKGMVGYVCK